MKKVLGWLVVMLFLPVNFESVVTLLSKMV